MAKKRKSISKKIRFEVFKRDSFTCQYCGRFAPDITLQVDHIIPVKDGGDNDLLNLVTSCFDCNSGKGGVQLSDQSALIRSRKQAKERQEQLEQIQMMADWQKHLRNKRDQEFHVIHDAFFGLINDHNSEYGKKTCWGATESGEKVIYRWLRQFELHEILNSILIAHEHYLRRDEYGLFCDNSVILAFNKVGGICYNRRKRGEA